MSHEHDVLNTTALKELIKEGYPNATDEQVDRACHVCCCAVNAFCTPADLKAGPIDKLTEAIKKLIANKDNILEMIELIMLFISMFADKKEASNA